MSVAENWGKIGEFKSTVYSFYEQYGRTFPWREHTEPWGVLVSEYMLQQTQTERVIPYFERWMRRWSTPEALHTASLEEALSEWVGLGYNRRCRFLKDCARIITEDYGGRVPAVPEVLRSLPGIGAYTAGAIACFAYNYPSVFIETNIRAAVIHFFLDATESVSTETPRLIADRDVSSILEAALEGETRKNPRLWYWALMDYGANLKKIHVNPNRKSAHYSKQSKFKGSLRQIRGGIIRTLTREGASTLETLLHNTAAREQNLYRALDSLQKDSLVCEHQGVYRIKEAMPED
ncbi:MAG: A/G-specific adenine glycosylase [Treponema sp.]|nr:A/G-specific adenine glycosylase [Treponema sp.]